MFDSVPSAETKADSSTSVDVASSVHHHNGNAMLPAVFVEQDLKQGLVVKALWNGENATIKEIKDGYVYYNSHIWKPKETFRDPIKVFLECFKPVSQNSR